MKEEFSHVKETFEERLIEVQRKTQEEEEEEFEEKMMEMQRKMQAQIQEQMMQMMQQFQQSSRNLKIMLYLYMIDSHNFFEDYITYLYDRFS